MLDKGPEESVGDRYTIFEDQILTVPSLVLAEAIPRGREGTPG